MDITAALEVPLTHKKPNTNGINAPLVRKSDPIHEIVNTDCIRNAINKANNDINKVETRPTFTSCLALLFLLIYFLYTSTVKESAPVLTRESIVDMIAEHNPKNKIELKIGCGVLLIRSGMMPLFGTVS